MRHTSEIQQLSPKATLRVTYGVWAILALTAWFAYRGQFVPLMACIVLLIVAAFCLPAVGVPRLLVVAVAVMPFAGNLGNDEVQGSSHWVAFGLTDLLLFAALPGAIRLFLARRRQVLDALPSSARNYWLWSLLFLLVCTVSLIVNRHTMTSGMLSYVANWFRVVQIVALLPFMFAVVDWHPRDFILMWSGYVCSVLCFAFMVIGFYIAGAGTFPVLGVHKNVVSLLVATGVIVALISLWTATPKERLVPRLLAEILLIFGMPALAASSSRIGLLCFPVGLLMISIHYRRLKVPLLMMAVLAVSLYLGVLVTPKWARGVTTSLTSSRSLSVRADQYQASLAHFRANPLLGDGLRARKDIQPHNLEILLLSETGVLGLVTFGGVLFAGFALFRSTLRAEAYAPMVSASLWILAACGVMILVHAHSEPFWRRGPVMFLGASVGICCALLRQKNANSPVSES